MRKSKEDRLVQQRMAVNATIGKMQQFIAELEPKKQLFIDKARQAKKIGASGQENSAKAALKHVVSQQRLAERMLVNFEIMANMRDLTEMSGEFLNGLTLMGKEMSKLTSKMNLESGEKELSKAMITAQVHTEKMTQFRDRMSMTVDSGFEEADGVTDEEIDNIVGYDETAERSALDDEIDRKLNDLEGKIRQR